MTSKPDTSRPETSKPETSKPDVWLNILRRRVAARGQAAVARELGVARSSVSMALSGTYPASTNRLERKVLSLYGADGQVQCPLLGALDPAACAEHHRQAQTLGLTCGNPQTLRLRKACLACGVRKGE